MEAKIDGLKNYLKSYMEAKMDGIEEKMKDNMEYLKNGLKVDMEGLKEGLSKLLQEMLPNGENLLDETRDENKRNVLEIMRGGVNRYFFQLEHYLIFNYYQCLQNDSSKQKEHKCTQFLRWKPSPGQKPPK